jgi:hypothetical protein
MSELSAALAVVVGVAVRLAIPVLLTVLIVQLLRIQDARWQREAEQVPQLIEKPACWDINDCPPDCRKNCPGYTSPLPCWQARRLVNGYLREECLSCKVFLKAPVPSLG